MTTFKKPYNYSKRESYRSSFKTSGDSLTVQSEKDSCDINRIMSKYGQTGLINHWASLSPQYADVSAVPSFQEAQQIVIDATDSFMSLPANIRKRFSNDPAEFLDFVSDEKNRNEMIEIGLLPPDPVETVVSTDAPQTAGEVVTTEATT